MYLCHDLRLKQEHVVRDLRLTRRHYRIGVIERSEAKMLTFSLNLMVLEHNNLFVHGLLRKLLPERDTSIQCFVLK